MKFEKEYFVGVKDIGINNKMTNFAILSMLEEIASLHSATCGYGVNDISRNKKVWILMDWKLKVIERPEYGDTLKAKTWARPIEKHIFFTYRDFEIFKGENKVAIATSKWVLFDLETNKISKIEDDVINLYKPQAENVFENKDIEKIKEVDEKNLILKYDVKRADIDINRHMHNLNYLQLAYEVLPEEIYFKQELQNVRIMYKHQVVLGDKINCYYTKQDNKNIVTIKNEKDNVVHAIIELN